MSDDQQKAIEVLKNGGVGIFPTDTAFGIGCRIDDEKAVERLFKLRKRAETKATPVLVSSVEMAREFVREIPDSVNEKLIKPYWPGALTIVLLCKTGKVPSLVRGGGETLGVRMPDNKDLISIINQVGVPILGTSANFAGGKTPFEFDDLDADLKKLVDFILKGECKTKRASTVIDCSVNPWRILRQGAVEINL